MPRLRLSRFLALAALLPMGCRHTAVAPAASGEGTSSIRFVDPAPPPARKGETAIGAARPTMQAINAQPILPLAKPVYPPAALAAHAGWASVGVRLTVDETGRVSAVQPSLAVISLPTPYVAEFQAAVEAAVAQWRFRPAVLLHAEWVSDPGGDYPRVTSREKIEWTFDVEFTFNASGDVLTRLPK